MNCTKMIKSHLFSFAFFSIVIVIFIDSCYYRWYWLDYVWPTLSTPVMSSWANWARELRVPLLGLEFLLTHLGGKVPEDSSQTSGASFNWLVMYGQDVSYMLPILCPIYRMSSYLMYLIFWIMYLICILKYLIFYKYIAYLM